MLNITVVVPTYRRPIDLARCLTALQQQSRPAHEVIVIVRDTDFATWDFLRGCQPAVPLQTATVKVPGVIAAMNLGLEQAHGEIIAFTDDDAAPHPDWLERIERHYLANDRVGGVGGRDWVREGGKLLDDARSIVGKVQWFGRTIGNHHLGVGAAREVDILKGVNMSWRRMAIAHLRFDDRLQGSGAQAHFEIAFSLAVRRAGWSIIYDPLVAVDHYPAERPPTDPRLHQHPRDRFNATAMTQTVHNETLGLLEHLPWPNRMMFLLWAVAIGTQIAPGLLQYLRFLPQEGALATAKWRASLQGRWQGWQTWHQTRFTELTKDSP
ncbi:glycosyltransferase family 2 protein [Chamaesiphon sp. GL140_3_metabinner_50]|uniref:glycosyltransferase family 2 protein n=1 Tax=Chamaesiphon sp. GL140_3_metabinner_50 TaxID=2970812 RepID=UPI0025DCA55A|nr:glycosyltransferase family 2 protein [Chamaesiphon sp. GL140_3_metabinner_50]